MICDYSKLKNIITFFSYKNLIFLLYVLIFVAGCYFRLNLYLQINDMHYDEIAIAQQVIERSYIGLFKPLDLVQVCPPVFLVIAKFLYSIFYNLHPTINFRDLIFRLLPLFSGIISVPLFGYFLNKLFKNPLINLAGMLLLAINPAHIVWSTIFKQYAFEALITILIMILFLNIDFETKNIKKNIFIFLLLGLLSFCSMTAIYLFPCGFIYLLTNIQNKNQFKLYSVYFLVFLTVFITYLFTNLLPVYIDHYSTMNSFWFQEADNSIGNLYNYISLSMHIIFRTANFEVILSVLFIISTILMLVKNSKMFLLTLLPLYITYLLIHFNQYPIAEKFLVFIIPLFITALIYPIKFIPSKLKIYNLFYLIFSVLFIFSITKVQSVTYINSGLLNTKTILTYLASHDKKDGKIIFFPDTNQMYNAKIYYDKFLLLDKLNPETASRKAEADENLPQGIYYIICANYTVKDGYKKTMEFLDNFIKNCEILEFKNFEGRKIYSHRPDKLGSFSKLTDSAIFMKVKKIK